MQSRTIFAIVRYMVLIAALTMAYLYFSYAVLSAWQTGVAPGLERPGDSAYEAYRALGISLAFVFSAVLVGINIRPNWPYLRSKWNLFLIGAALASLLVPPAWRLLAIDSCLDAGDAWDYEYERCSSLT